MLIERIDLYCENVVRLVHALGSLFHPAHVSLPSNIDDEHYEARE